MIPSGLKRRQKTSAITAFTGLIVVYALVLTLTYPRTTTAPSFESEPNLTMTSSSPPRLAIVSVSTPDRVQLYQPATNSKTCYSASHGYTLIMDTNDAESSLNPWWRKLTAMQKYLPYYDWVLFMDGDTVVTNYSVKLEWFLPSDNENIDLIVTDHNVALNNGVFFLRNSEWSIKFLAEWLIVGKQVHNRQQRWAWDDQGGFYEMLLRTAHERPGAPAYDGECSDPDNCCEYGALQRCYNRRLNAIGDVYGHRNVPHVKYIDPRFYAVPGMNEGWIRGGFDQYRKSEFNGQTWIYGEWSEDNFWKPGDFVLHSYDKSQMAQFVPKQFADSCADVQNYAIGNIILKQKL